MVLWNFGRQERRENVRKVNLLCAGKVSATQIEILRHGAELDFVRSQNMPQLAQSFFGADIRTGVARAIVASEQQLEFLARLPTFSLAEDPACLGALDIGADPGFEDEIHHATEPPTFAGQP